METPGYNVNLDSHYNYNIWNCVSWKCVKRIPDVRQVVVIIMITGVDSHDPCAIYIGLDQWPGLMLSLPKASYYKKGHVIWMIPLDHVTTTNPIITVRGKWCFRQFELMYEITGCYGLYTHIESSVIPFPRNIIWILSDMHRLSLYLCVISVLPIIEVLCQG